MTKGLATSIEGPFTILLIVTYICLLVIGAMKENEQIITLAFTTLADRKVKPLTLVEQPALGRMAIPFGTVNLTPTGLEIVLFDVLKDSTTAESAPIAFGVNVNVPLVSYPGIRDNLMETFM